MFFCRIRYIPLGSPTRRTYLRYVSSSHSALIVQVCHRWAPVQSRQLLRDSHNLSVVPQDDTQDPHPLPPRAPDEALWQAAITQVKWLSNSTVFANNSCALCTAVLQVAKFLSLAAPEQGPAFFVFACQQFKLSSACNTTYGPTTYGPVLTQVLANADVVGYDGRVSIFGGHNVRNFHFWSDVLVLLRLSSPADMPKLF